MKSKITHISLVLMLLPFIMTTPAKAYDISLELATGYDDNVSNDSTSEGSGFASYKIGVSKKLFSNLPSIDGDIFIDGNYRDHFQLQDNYQVSTGASFTLPLASGRFLPTILSEASIYRDDFMEEDSKDEIMVTGLFEWMATSRLNLGIRQSWHWQDYTEEVIVHADGSQHGNHGMGGNMQGQGSGQGMKQHLSSRDDQLSSTALQGRFFFTPSIEADLAGEYNYLNSSIDTESYQEKGLFLSLFWRPKDVWEISAKTFWKQADYDETSSVPERTDKIYHIGMGISYFIDKIELFFQFEHTKNDSTLDTETYHQMVTQCGISLSF